MSDFGKRGRCLHVSAVITSQGSIYIGKFQVDNFVLLFNSCTQNSFAVNFAYYLAYATHYHGLTSCSHNFFIHSDNAGCYHNGPLLVSLPQLVEREMVSD